MGRQIQMTQIPAKGMKANTNMNVGGMTMVSGISDGKMFSMMQMGNKVPMNDAMIEEQVISNALFNELVLKETGADLKLAGIEQINGSDAYSVEVMLSKGGKYTVYFDAASGLKVRYVKVTETPNGPITQTVDYMDYKEVDGVMFPHTMMQQFGPQKIELTATEVVVNQEVADDTFEVK